MTGKEFFKAGWKAGYSDGGEHDCRMVDPSAERAWHYFAKDGLIADGVASGQDSYITLAKAWLSRQPVQSPDQKDRVRDNEQLVVDAYEIITWLLRAVTSQHRFSMLAMKWESLSRSPWEKSRRFTFAWCARELRAAIDAQPAFVDDDIDHDEIANHAPIGTQDGGEEP